MKANGAIREDLIRLQNSINECINDLATARDRKDDGDEQIALRRMEALLEDAKQTCISVLFSLKEEPLSEKLESEIQRYYVDWDEHPEYVQTARHFAKWQKEQMMSKAIDAVVIVDRIGEVTYLCPHTKATSDKAKVIIIEED